MNKLYLACVPLLLLAACDSTPPDQILIGDWGIDPSHLEDQMAKAEKHGALAKSMAQAKAKVMMGVRASFSADGKIELRGGNLDSEGSYVVEQVEGNVVTVAMTPKNQPKSKLIFTVVDKNHMVMSDASKAWSMQLIRG